MTNNRVYLLVAVDKSEVLDGLAASTTVRACLQTVWFEDVFAVADVTDLVVTEQRNFDSDRYPEEWNYSLLDAVDKLS